jgi:hypothetical protein
MLYGATCKSRTGGWAGDKWYAERDNYLVGVIPACEQVDELLLLEVAGPGYSLHVHESTQYVSLEASLYRELDWSNTCERMRNKSSAR